MLLNETQIAACRETLGAPPVADDHPALPDLKNAFGEHTFFVDQNGLAIFLHPEETETELPGGEPRLIMIAAWADAEKTQLGAVEPQDTGITLPVPPGEQA